MEITEKRVTLRLPPELYAQIEGVADYHLRSVNSEIIYLLRVALEGAEGCREINCPDYRCPFCGDLIESRGAYIEHRKTCSQRPKRSGLG